MVLASPFGGFATGWDGVSEALDEAASKFRDGNPVRFDEAARYVGANLFTLVEAEHWETKVGGAAERSEIDLRVTVTFRLEDGGWKLVCRHADAVTAVDAAGPPRAGR
jgi:ketosteroid isomerase-like protein